MRDSLWVCDIYITYVVVIHASVSCACVSSVGLDHLHSHVRLCSMNLCHLIVLAPFTIAFPFTSPTLSPVWVCQIYVFEHFSIIICPGIVVSTNTIATGLKIITYSSSTTTAVVTAIVTSTNAIATRLKILIYSSSTAIAVIVVVPYSSGSSLLNSVSCVRYVETPSINYVEPSI